MAQRTEVLSFATGTVDAVGVAIIGRRRDWVHYQGRANAALMLLARAMDAEFVHPESETEFATVRGALAGCTFELNVHDIANEPAPALLLTLRHFDAQTTVRLDGRGCTVPELDPARMRDVLDDACRTFATH